MAKGARGGKRSAVDSSDAGGSLNNGFNGQEHAVTVEFGDGQTLTYRIKGTQMYRENSGSNMMLFGGDNTTYDVPVNQAEILMNNARKNGYKATLLNPKELKKRDDDIAKKRKDFDENFPPRRTKKGINRHRAYWSAM